MSEPLDCKACHQTMHIEYGDEPPEHGLCWRCSSDRVTELEKRIRRAILVSEVGKCKDAIQDMLYLLDPNDDIWTDNDDAQAG